MLVAVGVVNYVRDDEEEEVVMVRLEMTGLMLI